MRGATILLLACVFAMIAAILFAGCARPCAGVRWSPVESPATTCRFRSEMHDGFYRFTDCSDGAVWSSRGYVQRGSCP